MKHDLRNELRIHVGGGLVVGFSRAVVRRVPLAAWWDLVGRHMAAPAAPMLGKQREKLDGMANWWGRAGWLMHTGRNY